MTIQRNEYSLTTAGEQKPAVCPPLPRKTEQTGFYIYKKRGLTYHETKRFISQIQARSIKILSINIRKAGDNQ